MRNLSPAVFDNKLTHGGRLAPGRQLALGSQLTLGSPPSPRGFSTAGGFTLIEVLVSALIMGIGLLGLVSLQTRALQYNQQAYLYSQAAFLAQDIAERMRANKNVADNYTIDFEDSVSGVTTTTCLNGDCDENTLANWDLKLWKANLATSLPQGDGSITKIGDQYVITTQFDESRGENTALKQISITTQI